MSTGTLKVSILQYGTNSHVTTSEEANYFATDFVSPGITGSIANTNGFAPATGGFAVNAETSPSMAVQVTGSGATVGAYVNVTPATQDAQTLRTNMIGNNDITIAANSSGVTKYDWIYLKVDPTLANNPDVTATTVATFVTSRSTNSSTDNGGSTPTYGILLAVVTVINGATQITSGNIQDRRIQAGISAPVTVAGATTGWNSLATDVFAYGSNLGNKEFTVTNGNNLTGILTAGMKFSAQRSVTPPTQSMAFIAANSQYATKSSPSGITFTSAFTCEAWVKLNSYTGSSQFVMEHENGTSGWGFNLTATGQVNIYYGSGSSFTNLTSYQSIPLGQWVHVAGVVSSVSSQTASIYINGLLVGSSVSGSATALVQPASTDLRVGAYNTPGQYFDGEISEPRVWSVAQSQTLVQNNMGINVVGTETNLVFALQTGAFTDLTTNGNTLTAVNSAIATQADNPYNATEYALITKVVYTGGVTTLTLKTVSGTIPNMALSNAQYSVAANPYGWPSVKGSLQGHTLLWLPLLSSQTTTSTTPVAFSTPTSGFSGWTFTVPQGCSKIRLKAFNTSSDSGSANTMVFQFFNGSITLGQKVGQVNVTDANGYVSFDIGIPVVAGSVFTLNMAWYTTGGTAQWGSSGTKSTDNGIELVIE